MISEQRDSAWWFALNGAARAALVRGANPFAFYPLINEYPKSGGSWLSQMLGAALGLPNPRNRLPLLRSSIMHGHYLQPQGLKNVVLVARDGRDVIVSLYHHLISANNFASSRGQDHARGVLRFGDPAAVAHNLPSFIEANARGELHPRFGWGEFYARWIGHPCIRAETRYEAMLADAAGELYRIQRALGGFVSREECEAIADRFSFARQAGRRPGQEDRGSFLRKGIAGDWRRIFTRAAAEVFDRYHGDTLIALGYEPNREWIGHCPGNIDD